MPVVPDPLPSRPRGRGRVRRWVTRVLVTALGLLVVCVTWMLLIYPTEYVRRTLLWMDADVGDVQRFPSREIAASDEPSPLDRRIDPDITTALSAVLTVDDVEQHLAELDTQALIVARDGTIVYEGYFNGFTADSVATSFSVAKSFDSTLLGIALEEGFIDSLDQPITEHLPELLDRDPAFAEITIRDLISMSSGIHYVEYGIPPSDDAKTYYWPDLRSLALETTVIEEEPGARFLYNNYNPLLEGLIIERATGMTVSEYLSTRIWQPMGAEHEATWSLDSTDGFEKMESGINAHPIDFARFGIMFLEGGMINGRRVVSVDWIELATQPTRSAGSAWYPEEMASTERIGYALHWWTIDGSHGLDYVALGNHGQFIYVSPPTGVVVVRNARSYGMEAFEWMETFYEFADALPPA